MRRFVARSRLVVDGVGVTALRPLLLPGRQRRKRPFARAGSRFIPHGGGNSAAGEGEQMMSRFGRQVMHGHLLIVRNDLEGHWHQISGSDHLLLLQAARMLMVVVHVVVMVAAMLVGRQTVRRSVTFAADSRARPALLSVAAGLMPQLVLVVKRPAPVRIGQIGVVSAAGRRRAAITADGVVLQEDDSAFQGVAGVLVRPVAQQPPQVERGGVVRLLLVVRMSRRRRHVMRLSDLRVCVQVVDGRRTVDGRSGHAVELRVDGADVVRMVHSAHVRVLAIVEAVIGIGRASHHLPPEFHPPSGGRFG